MAVNELEIRKQVRRLLVVFNSSKPEAEIVEGWKWVLGDKIDNVEMMSAVSEYAQSGSRYFPSPGQILDAARSKRTPATYEDRAARNGNGPDPAVECPTCGQRLRELKPEEQVWVEWDEDTETFKNIAAPAKNPRLGILHDYRKHREAGAATIGSYRR